MLRVLLAYLDHLRSIDKTQGNQQTSAITGVDRFSEAENTHRTKGDAGEAQRLNVRGSEGKSAQLPSQCMVLQL